MNEADEKTAFDLTLDLKLYCNCFAQVVNGVFKRVPPENIVFDDDGNFSVKEGDKQ